MLLPLNILKVTPFKVTLVLQTLGPYTTGKEADLESCVPPRTAMDTQQTAMVGVIIPPFLD